MAINLNDILADPDPLNPLAPMAPTPYAIVSMGHRNAWRISLQGGKLFEAETGWYLSEVCRKLVTATHGTEPQVTLTCTTSSTTSSSCTTSSATGGSSTSSSAGRSTQATILL